MTSSATPGIRGYRLAEEIGRGGMGVVYRAQRVRDGADVAVKIIHPRLSSDPAYRRRLRAEAERAALVGHPGIIRVLEVADQGDEAWVAMELIHGPDLQHLIETQGPPPLPVAAELIAQTADTLSAVHRAGFVHRDVKPANILVERRSGERPWRGPGERETDGQGTGRQPGGDLQQAGVVGMVGVAGMAGLAADAPLQARLADFGIATALVADDDMGLSDADAWISTTADLDDPGGKAGTLVYMAPEQWSGGTLSAATDIYALGASLYTALTGKPPFPQVSLPELVYAVTMTPPPAPSQSVPTLPAAFDAIVARAMAKDPADRYPDAAALARAIRAAVDGRPVPEAARPSAQGADKGVRRRWPAAAGAIVIALAAIVTALALWSPWAKSHQGAGEQPGERTLRRTVCSKGPGITVRDQPAGATIHRLARGTKVTEYPDRNGGSRYWRWVRADNGASGYALTQFLRSSCSG